LLPLIAAPVAVIRKARWGPHLAEFALQGFADGIDPHNHLLATWRAQRSGHCYLCRHVLQEAAQEALTEAKLPWGVLGD